VAAVCFAWQERPTGIRAASIHELSCECVSALYGHLTIRVLLNCKAWMRVDLVTRMFVLSAQWHRDLHCKDF
jgi:hypothetical protein